MRAPLALASAALLAAACATGSDRAAKASPAGSTDAAAPTWTYRVTVEEVYAAERTLAVRVNADETEALLAGSAVPSLAGFAPGDTVEVTVRVGVLLEHQPAGAGAVAPQTVIVAGRAYGDALSGATAAVQGTVTVAGIEWLRRLVTLEAPDGSRYRVRASPTIAIEALKVGDRLLATYVRSVAVAAQKDGGR